MLATLLAAILMGGPATAAFAQAAGPDAEAEPSREALERAGKHFQNGAEAYTAGNYSKAIVAFLKAYNEVPNALFLYNISLSYGKLGNVEDALAAARKARDGEGMDAQTANRNEARIAAYERWTVATETAADIVEAKARASAESTDEPPAQPNASAGAFGGLGWVGVGLMVAGGGLGTGSALIANGLREPIEDFEAAGRDGDAETYDELKTEIRSRQSVGKALLFAASGTAAIGLVLVLIDLGNGPTERANAFVSPTADGGAVAGFQTRF
jgi:tetratricopeptide (TPR) repeat protein